jgi:hypothetical protein
MTTALRAIGISLAIGHLGACSTIHKSFDIDGTPPKSLSVDAKQRVILVTDRGGPQHNRHVACAEPSPDVFVAAAASASVSADVAKQSGQGSAQYAETAATLSRGHTIQLLRDGLYRACEAYLNGAVDEHDYRDLLVFYDITMITTLAIEGVTQPKIPASTSIGAQTTGGAPGTGGQGTEPPPTAPAPANPTQQGTAARSDAALSAAAAVQATEMLKVYFDTKLRLFDRVHQAGIERAQMKMKGQ